MNHKFPEYKELDLAQVNQEVLAFWEADQTFAKSLQAREGRPSFVFYEGPPSANGKPGIHHVMARTVKDIYCRFQTQKGFHVKRKAGWDTHGLPVELDVENRLGIVKTDIGTKISVAEFNQACRKAVMEYTDMWESITAKMGYWVDMKNPYVTYHNQYIESVWNLLKRLYDKDLLYRGHSIQPYSPAAGTGLSSHELNQPGCYRDVKDTTVVAQFRLVRDEVSDFLFAQTDTPDVHILAWTTTPWTLPSNTALAMGANIDYLLVRTFNPYTRQPVSVVLAKDLFREFFPEKNDALAIEDFQPGQKQVPHRVLGEFKGARLELARYEQLMPEMPRPEQGDAFRVLMGDFVTTSDGTGIVHIAPSFGADDARVAQKYGVGALTLVNKQGRFVEEAGFLAGRFVKNEYSPELGPDDETTDVFIAVTLKNQNKAFRVAKYEHSYPHCWRTDKPVLYYPLDSSFIRTTAVKQRLKDLNNTINWKPAATGTGRFGQWLENLVDWNLTRSRFWGTPLPIWVSEDRSETVCVGSMAELKHELQKSVEAGFMASNPLADFRADDFSDQNYNRLDLHRPTVDELVLVSPTGKPMRREPDLIDVWFDSGAMPYAQLHYPFENKEVFEQFFPADFIAEGVDQTRGWFFTLHAIATMVSDSVSFKAVVSNGLVLDKDGKKMSKRLGNAVDPFKTLDQHGADAVRWYMTTNTQPWESLKFDLAGVEEARRKFFGTLQNTYAFFALYANVDGFRADQPKVGREHLQETDRWILSHLNSLIRLCDERYQDYDATAAARAIQHFVIEHLSNWYVRLNRKRFWSPGQGPDKLAAYQTLHECLLTVARLAAPVMPFYAEKLYRDLVSTCPAAWAHSVHLSDFPVADEGLVDKELEERMDMAQTIASMVLSLRRKVKIKVRQPLRRLVLPVLDAAIVPKVEAVRDIILREVNVKELDLLTDTTGILVKSIKPNFRQLGQRPQYRSAMKAITTELAALDQAAIARFEASGRHGFQAGDGQAIELELADVEIVTKDMEGWEVATDGKLTVALDIHLSPELLREGMARELVNRIQNLRKDMGLEVTDKIRLALQSHPETDPAVNAHRDSQWMVK